MTKTPSAHGLDDFLSTWEVTRSLTHALLDHLDESALRRAWPRPGLDSYAKHFEELAVVQRAFNNAMVTGKMDFSNVPSVHEFGGGLHKQVMRQALDEADAELRQIVKDERISASEIEWDGTSISIAQHMVNYINHETFHHGQFALAAYLFDLDLPQIWKETWALP